MKYTGYVLQAADGKLYPQDTGGDGVPRLFFVFSTQEAAEARRIESGYKNADVVPVEVLLKEGKASGGAD